MSKHGVTEFLQVFSGDESTFVNIETDMLVVLDESGNILRVNPAFEKSLNRQEIDVLRNGFIRYVHQDDLAKFMHSFDDSSKADPFRISKMEHGFITVRLSAYKFRRTEDGLRGYLVLRLIYDADAGLEWQHRINWSQ
jgi:PAS domain-containing protein